MMFKVTALAVMLLGLVISSGTAETPQLRGSRALDIDDGDRALDSDDGGRALDGATEPESLYPKDPDHQHRDRDDPCWYAARFLDPGCYSWTPRRGGRGRDRGCSVRPLKEDNCDQKGYGYATCDKNVCSPYNGRRYTRKCGTRVAAFEGYVCKAPTYTVGQPLDTCVTPSTCQSGTCSPCIIKK